MDLKKTLTIPVKDRDNLIRLFIGGLLDILPIVNLFSSGYAFLLMQNQIVGEPAEDLPPWDNWGKLFKYGLLTFIASLGYGIIPLIVIGMGTAALYPHVGILTFIGVTLIIIGAIFFLAAIFLFPMGLVLFAIEDEFSAVFSFFRIIEMVSKHFWIYFRVFIIVFVMGLILGFFSYIPIVGWIIGVFVGFYILIETALLMGDVGREIAGTPEPARASDPLQTAAPAEPATSPEEPAAETDTSADGSEPVDEKMD